MSVYNVYVYNNMCINTYYNNVKVTDIILSNRMSSHIQRGNTKASRLSMCTIIRATVRGYLTYPHNFVGDADDVVARISANLETSDVESNFRNSTVEYVPRHSRRVTF